VEYTENAVRMPVNLVTL